MPVKPSLPAVALDFTRSQPDDCPTMTRYRIILNPAADRGAAANMRQPIEHAFQSRGLAFDLVLTERPGHAIELARSAAAEGCEAVIAAGGDGTANEVLNGLMRARQAGDGRPPMGVLCVGRGNDFAFGVGIPKELDAACDAIAAGRTRTVDVGRVIADNTEARYFGNGVGIGFDAVVGFVAARLKHLHGFPAYLVAALKTIFVYFKAPRVRVEYAGQSKDFLALMVSIMNGRRMGGGFMMAPDGDPSDGMLDLCIAEQVSRLGIFALIPRFMKGTQATRPSISTGRTDCISVTAIQGTLPAHADGETLCEVGSNLTIEILPRQMEVFVPGEMDSEPVR